ncbi:hypothetical protein BU25DRAFT_409094 [Macroventuria anomochaeta]|uniref:Uncharacterized protein n=1 Tax=Macroventuria anomochaeta TaxID=301207 RepID=A0ACB6S6L6_9PLEO|nr:uncharacterized protein BU25DRAFT_409094 [Macroventuria anomochaeta]KAF2629836.1 hypothetical protein BU25DRAFT_409094 [Macroventuria anomochaeta]
MPLPAARCRPAFGWPSRTCSPSATVASPADTAKMHRVASGGPILVCGYSVHLPVSVTQSHACMKLSERSGRPNNRHWQTIAGAALASSSIDVPLRLLLHTCAICILALHETNLLARCLTLAPEHALPPSFIFVLLLA